MALVIDIANTKVRTVTATEAT